MIKKWLVAVALVASAFVAGMGCGGDDGDGGSGGFEFVNNSSYTVTVEPGNGEDFAAFALAPGNDKRIGSANGDQLNFAYGPGPLVAVNTSPGLAVFVNR